MIELAERRLCGHNGIVSVLSVINWLQAVPRKSWFMILRMYEPLEPWINKTLRPWDELVK
jgi:hypothetical protein